MKSSKMFLVLFNFFLLVTATAFSQGADSRIPIAIVDFIPAKDLSANNGSVTSSVYELLVDAFSIRKESFRVLDRSAMAQIDEEVNTEHGEQFLNGPNLIAEGKRTGAKYMATGVITLYNKTAATTNSGASAQISFALKIIDLESGEIKYHQVISKESSYVFGSDPTSAALSKIRTELNNIVFTIFPKDDIEMLSLVQFDSTKSRVEKVMINKGEADFPKPKPPFFGKPKLIVSRREVINSGKGTRYINDIKIGELKLDKWQNQVSIWSVSADDHGKQIFDISKGAGLNTLIITVDK